MNIRVIFIILTAATLVSCSSSVHDLAARGDVDALATALEANPELLELRNDLGKTPLHYAINSAQREAMIYLIESGAELDAKDNTGLTPLHIAAIIDLPGAAQLLLREGSQLEAQDQFGDTPLLSSAIHGSLRVFDYLIAQGANSAATNFEGIAVSQMAKNHGRMDILERFQIQENSPQ